MHKILVLPQNVTLEAVSGENLHALLVRQGFAPAAPCGGNGKCGKCEVLIDGQPCLSCRTWICEDMTVTLPASGDFVILKDGIAPASAFDAPVKGYSAAFDLGTTTLVCYLMGMDGQELTSCAMANPQQIFGADVVSRIRSALNGHMDRLTGLVRQAMTYLLDRCCTQAGITPEQIRVVSVVGNPAMQQLFLGISPENLVRVPYSPVLTRAEVISCKAYLPACGNADLLVIPDISGYVGADTVGCILATGMYEEDAMTLLVDIGTNGEMVLGNRHRMLACATAAGPALEGAQISCGMAAQAGAIDHVWLEEQDIRSSVIGGTGPLGICGSGLVDAAAVHLQLGNLNARGKLKGDPLPVSGGVQLCQEDIRQLQLAKGAICAGIRLLCAQMGITYGEIDRVLLAGGFGTFLNTENACRIGLLPMELRGKITAVGNGAGTGAKLLARSRALLATADAVAKNTEYIELSQLREFPKAFASAMRFPD